MNVQTPKNKHILIIGGMGPQASLYAHSLILKQATKTGAIDNDAYPRITHLSINVTDFISEPAHRDKALAYILRCLRDVNLEHVDAAFIACNTAHVLADEIVRATGLPLTSLVAVTQGWLHNQTDISRIGILATPSTIETGLYQQALQGRTVVLPSKEAAAQIEGVIRDVIAGGDEKRLAEKLEVEIAQLRAAGAQSVILGCTELSLLGAHLSQADVIDPLTLTIQKITEHI